MKKKLLKSMRMLLVAAGLCAGAGASWAQTTLYERGGDGTAWSDTDAAEWVPGGTYDETKVVTSFAGNAFVMTSKANARTNYAFTKTLETTPAASSKIVLTATWTPICYGSNDSQYAYFEFGDIQLRANRSGWWSKIVVNGNTTSLTATDKSSLEGSWNITLTIDQQLKTVAYSITHAKGTDASTVAISGNADYSKIKVGLNGSSVNWGYDYSQTLTAIKVTEEVATKTPVNYTVNYLCGETPIKDAVTRYGFAGDAVTLLDADKAAVVSADGSVKYSYESDNTEGLTIAEDGTTQVNIQFTAANKFTYSTRLVDESNTVLKVLNEGYSYAGENVTAYWSKFHNIDGVWYSGAALEAEPLYGHEFTSTEVLDITAKATKAIYFAEAENIATSVAYNYNKKNTSSNGNDVMLKSGGHIDTKMNLASAGVFDIYVRALQRNNSGTTRHLYIVSGGTETEQGKTIYVKGNTYDEYKITGVALNAGDEIRFKEENGGNDVVEYDYIYVVRSTEEVPVNAYGTATYTTTNALDFTGVTTVKAYTAAQQADGTVLFTLVEGAVPVNTPLLVRGTTTDVPVAASAETVSTLMVAGTGAAVASEAGGKYNFILNVVGDVVGFYKAAGQTVAENRAYLSLSTDPTATNGANSRLTIRFSDENETTGINETPVENYREGTVCNLNGMRVMHPVKGLYIQNGRKFIVK